MRKKYITVKRCLIENVEHKRVNQENLQRVIYDGVPDMPSEDISNYILFESDTSFTVAPNTKSWDGTLYYSTDGDTWSEYTADTIVSNVKKCYFRGTGNTVMSNWNNDDPETPFCNTEGENISVSGNIESLLDYETVENGEHPEMSEYCFSSLFAGKYDEELDDWFNTWLVTAPQLPATTLADYCYQSMFSGCTSLKIKQDGGTIFFNYTSSMSFDSAVNRMFNNTSGTFAGTPSAGHTYGYE